MTTVAVIPARYTSTRFPGKPLANQTGKYLIQHVYEQVCACGKIHRVLVGTDDDRIVEAVKSFGGHVVMTRSDHASGTHRVAEVADALALADDDLVLNVQGDEPEINPSVLDRLIEHMRSSSDGCRIATLAAPFDDRGPREGPGSPLDPHCVKVVIDRAGRALYFSRSPIPYSHRTGGVVDEPSRWLLHLGVYGFRADALRSVTAAAMPPGGLEETESLEQLGWLEQGWPIAVVRVEHRFVGIDTPEDYAAFVRRVGQQDSVATT